VKAFVVRCVAFMAIQALLLAGLAILYQWRVGWDHYLSAFRDKEERLEGLAPPRVLLVGGSSLAFGTNSRAIEHALGRPVVNLGLNAGLGLEFILRQAEASMGSGDLVILSPEYNLFGLHQTGDPRILLEQVSLAPIALRFVSAVEIPGCLDDGLSVVSSRLHELRFVLLDQAKASVYRRSGFDARGDMVAHHGLRGSAKAEGGFLPPPDDLRRACVRLVTFAERARERGVRVVLSPPPLPEGDVALEGARVEEMWSSFARATGLRVLPTPRALPLSLFFDTRYHLLLEGKRRRTQALLAALKQDRPDPP
jgi:hypothetical protein